VVGGGREGFLGAARVASGLEMYQGRRGSARNSRGNRLTLGKIAGNSPFWRNGMSVLLLGNRGMAPLGVTGNYSKDGRILGGEFSPYAKKVERS